MSGLQDSLGKPRQWEGYVTEGHVLMARARDHFRFHRGAVKTAFYAGVAGIAVVAAMTIFGSFIGLDSAGRRADEVRLERAKQVRAELKESRETTISDAVSGAAAAYDKLVGRYADPAAVDKLGEAPSEGEMLSYFVDWANAQQKTGSAPKDWAVVKAKALPAKLDASTVTELETRHGLLAVGAAKGQDGKPRPFAWLLRKGEWAVILVDDPAGSPQRRDALVDAMREYVNANRKDIDDAKFRDLLALSRGEGKMTVYPAHRLGPAMVQILDDVSN